MVEAAGIEPASEGIPQDASTCLSSSLFSPCGTRRGRVRSASLWRFRSPGSRLTRSAIPLVGAPAAPRERAGGTAA